MLPIVISTAVGVRRVSKHPVSVRVSPLKQTPLRQPEGLPCTEQAALALAPRITTTKIIYANSVCVIVGFGGELRQADTHLSENGTVGEGQCDLTPIVMINRRVGLPLREAPPWGSHGESAL